jgi:dolichol kinase
MIPFILTILVVLVALVVNEWWWRDRTHGEISRKAVHISVGTFVAFWPLFLTWRQIEILSLAFVVVVLISQKFQIFRALHSVQRPTWGELFFGLSVGLVAVTTHSPAIYVVALLHMSLADGFAAITGVKYGARNAYMVFGARKSLTGTITFAAVSTLILVGFVVQHHTGFHVSYIPLIVGAAVLENIAVRGLDNLLIPILVAIVLSQIA